MSDFERIAFLDEPPIAGAQWWQKSVQGEVSRRTLLIAGTAASAFAIAATVVAVSTCADAPETTEERAALDMQRRYGWSFGANGEVLTLTGISAESDPLTGSTQRAQLPTLRLDPPEAWLKPFYQAALLEVSTAHPLEPPPADTSVMVPFPEAFVPIAERDLSMPFRAGLALARVLARVKEKCALVVDCTGAESIAIAAGAADVFTPVLLMPNWPHPRGVVKSHQALAALVIFQRYFTLAETTRAAGAPPVFVLDADRVAPLASAEQSFDNRYRAALPPAQALQAAGIQHLFYVRPVEATANDTKDVHVRFSEYGAAGIVVHMVHAADFFVRYAPSIPPTTAPKVVVPPDRPLPAGFTTLGDPPSSFGGETDDLPAFRATYFGEAGTAFGKGGQWKPPAPDPVAASRSVGMVPVVIAGGIILGAAMARQRDSWSRSWGGGGG